jgi:hypothetical protein
MGKDKSDVLPAKTIERVFRPETSSKIQHKIIRLGKEQYRGVVILDSWFAHFQVGYEESAIRRE